MQGLLSVMAMGDTIQDTKILPIHVLNSVLKQGPAKLRWLNLGKVPCPVTGGQRPTLKFFDFLSPNLNLVFA